MWTSTDDVTRRRLRVAAALRLYGVTDRRWIVQTSRNCSGLAPSVYLLEQQVELALKGGATMIQLREKGISDTEFLEEAKRLRQITDRYHAPLIINDRIDIAMACKADGVHVGQSDMEAGKAREMLGTEKILGVTAKTVEQARHAQQSGADYIGSGAVFGSSTKEEAKPMSWKQLKDICCSVEIPVVAIGGINSGNVERLAGSGIAGAAVVSGMFGEPDVFLAASTLRKKLDKMIEAEQWKKNS